MPRYSKRHYEDAADIFVAERPNESWDPNKHVQHNQLLKQFADLFERDNPKFQRDRFINAAGGYVGKSAFGLS